MKRAHATCCGRLAEGEQVSYAVLNNSVFVYVQAEELFLWIPRKMLMTVESAQNSVLGKDFSISIIELVF